MWSAELSMGPPNRYPRRCSPCPHPRGLPCFHLRFILLLMFFFYRPPPCSAQRSISNTHIQTTFWLLKKRGRASTSQVQALACRKMHTSIFRHRTKCLLPNRNLPTELGPSPFRHYWTVTPSLWGQAEKEDSFICFCTVF